MHPRDKMMAGFVSQGKVDLREVPVPELEEGAVLVEMKCSGICGTDLEKLRGGYTASVILGHEVSGVIAESKSHDWKKGDYVIPHHHVACGECYLCAKGAETMCEGFHTSNFDPCGFAEYFRVPAYNVSRGGVHRFNGMSFEEASFVEPLGCCIRGFEKAIRADKLVDNPRRVSNALVVGAGPIGLLHMELLRDRVPDLDLVAVDISDTRLAFAEKFEHAKPIKPSVDGTFSQDLKLTHPGGMDLVVVSTGSPAAFAEATKCVRKSGVLLLFGAPAKGSTFPLDLQSMLLREMTFTSSYATTEVEISKAISLLENKRIIVDKFLTSRFPLEDINAAMESARSEGQVKVVVVGN